MVDEDFAPEERAHDRKTGNEIPAFDEISEDRQREDAPAAFQETSEDTQPGEPENVTPLLAEGSENRRLDDAPLAHEGAPRKSKSNASRLLDADHLMTSVLSLAGSFIPFFFHLKTF